MKRIIFLVSIIFVLSCKKTINTSLPELEPKLVINSFFTSDSLFKVNISKTLSTLSLDEPVIQDADVKLYKDGAFLENLQFNQGNYWAQNQPQIGSVYRIEVEANGFPKAVASDSVPDYPSVSNVQVNPNYRYIHNEYDGRRLPISKIKMTIDDNLNSINYYELVVYRVVTYGSETHNIAVEIIQDKSENVSTKEVAYTWNKTLFTNKYFNSNHQIFPFDVVDRNRYGNDPFDLHIILRKVSKNYFIYQKSKLGYTYYNDVWEEATTTPIYTNIQDGYGIFGAYQQIEGNVLIPNSTN